MDYQSILFTRDSQKLDISVSTQDFRRKDARFTSGAVALT